jgi:uncharacterized membrane protein YbhN (UPF0104 family)
LAQHGTVTRNHRLRLLIQAGVTVGILVALVLVLNPGRLGPDIARFPLLFVPAALGLTLCVYLAKGLRYHQILRSEGVTVTPRASVLFTVGGETFGLLPLGELARGELASEATGAPLGTTLAGVTVQEMLYTTIIVAVAIPGAVAYTAGISGIAVSLFGIVAILGVLTIHPVFHAVLAVIRRIPFVNRAATQLEVLHEQTVRLLRRPGTWTWAILSVLQALLELTLFWLVIRGTSGSALPWVTTTFIYGAAYLTGAAISPVGGVGGFESTAIALLTAQGVGSSGAFAAVLILRAADKGVITTLGIAAWFWVRRHIRRRRGLLLGDGLATRDRSPHAPSGVSRPAPRLSTPAPYAFRSQEAVNPQPQGQRREIILIPPRVGTPSEASLTPPRGSDRRSL